MTKDKKEYNVREKLNNGRKYVHVKIEYNGETYLDKGFKTVEEATKIADITILKNMLPYETKRFKPVNKNK